MQPSFVDFHCHPAMKPYGKTWAENPNGQNTTDTDSDYSIWHRNPPNDITRAVQLVAGIAKFTQADFTTLVTGDCTLVFPSLYSVEKGFFDNKLGDGTTSRLVDNFITCVGADRVAYIQGINNYFEDLQKEYNYYVQLHNTPVSINGVSYKYYLVGSYAEMQNYIANNADADKTLFVAITIEGLHTLNSNLSAAPVEADFIANLRTIKQWQYPPLFITFCHHFYNQLCGHAQSLFDIVGKETDQSEGMNSSFSPLGLTVLKEMLDDTNGKRIYPDIKHMSAQGRKDYFAMLANDYAAVNIPVIVSHGAANGRRSMDEQVVDSPAIGNTLMANDINFYDNEIIAVAKSNGIFCLMLDEHRLASADAISQIQHSLFLNKIRIYRSALVWNQIQYIAELLDRNGLNAWDCLALGSDSDGIINPLNGFLTEETIPDLQGYLRQYASDYMNNTGNNLLQPQNRLDANTIIDKIFATNGMAFAKQWFV